MGTRVSISRLCRGCMNVLEKPDLKCEFCGFDRNEQVFVKEHLRLECILRGKYLVGKCVRETNVEKTYIGWNLSYDTKVIIKEYFSRDMMSRESYESGKVVSKKNVSVEVVKKNVSKFIAQAELMAFAPNKIINITESFRENGTGYYIVECLGIGGEEGELEVKRVADFELIKPSEYEENKNAFSEQEDIFAKRTRGLTYNIQPAKSEVKGDVDKNVISNSSKVDEGSNKKGVRYIDIRINDDEYVPKEVPNPVTISFGEKEEVKEVIEKNDTTSKIVIEQLKNYVFENPKIVVGTIIAAFCCSMIVGTFSGKNVESKTEEDSVVSATSNPSNEKFLFSEPGGSLECAVCDFLGKNASELYECILLKY